MASGIKGFKNINPNREVVKIVISIQNLISGFVASREYQVNTVTKKNENQFSQAICVYLSNRESRYYFCREVGQKATYTIDIGVYKGASLIYTIEAKVLPTPISGDRKEHEYVYGKGGGIQRFKDENHGLDNQDNLIPRNGMIGYVKSESFQYWQSKVNEWITDASWNNSEHLSCISDTNIGVLKSRHQRKNGSRLDLDHFWVNVN